ncbi:MAG: hypothetical protein IT314_09860 [Anaerolineales bacterium]|nr:hypothetical protein [Anaerolineales bacterium]
MKKYTLWLAANALLLAILACNIGAPSLPQDEATEQPADVDNAPTSSPEQQIPEQQGCANPYQPIVVGATWNYDLKSSHPDKYTHSILSADNDGFVEQDAFDSGVTRQGEWKCENGNHIALNPSGGASANVSAEGMQTNFQTTSIEGLTLPAVINPGDTWAQALTLEGTQNINGLEIPAKNEFKSQCTAIAVESVTVPAGTFDAMHVDCEIDMTITVTMNGNDIQTPLKFMASSWYAEKVGMVKTVSNGEQFDSTVELLSYTIP